LRNWLIQLEPSDTKDREPRRIPILDELYEILKAIPRAIHDPYVFLYKGKPIRDLRTGLRDACRKAAITYGRFKKDGFVFHDLKHTFNTTMRKAGMPKSVIMSITGHSTREMFDRYNTVDIEDTRQAIDRLRDYLQSVPQNVPQVPSDSKKGLAENPLTLNHSVVPKAGLEPARVLPTTPSR
jgi:integrase